MPCKGSFIYNIILSTQTLTSIVWRYNRFASNALNVLKSISNEKQHTGSLGYEVRCPKLQTIPLRKDLRAAQNLQRAAEESLTINNQEPKPDPPSLLPAFSSVNYLSTYII